MGTGVKLGGEEVKEIKEVKEKTRISHRGRRGSTLRLCSGQAEGGEKRGAATGAVWVGLKCCHGPSATWPTRQNSARKKKSATPVGMTELGGGREAA